MRTIIRRLLPSRVFAEWARAYRKSPLKRTQPIPPEVLQCYIASNRYGDYCVPLSASWRPAARAVLASDVFEAETIEYITSHCGAGDIIHGGTFFGDFLPALSKYCQGTIWAFEPVKENFRCAEITKLINELNNVSIHHAALGYSYGTVLMQVIDKKGRTLGGASRISENGGESVKLISIDSTVPQDRTISIIHLDVEGYEQNALTGALQTIIRCLPTLILETLPDPEFIEKNLSPLGYETVGEICNNFILMPSWH